MRRLRTLGVLAGATVFTATAFASLAMAAQERIADFWQSPSSADKENYVRIPMPPGVQVVDSELDGPVFADANGKTLYSFPLTKLRNGDTGDRKDSGKSSCTDEVQ